MLWVLAGISFIAVVVTGYDKWAAKHRPRNRTPERTLWLIALLCGSVAMLITMLTVRHKTKHRSFMIGLPLMIVAQIWLIIGIYRAVF